MDNLLDRFFEEVEVCLKGSFPRYMVKASQLGALFLFLLKDLGGKILKDGRALLKCSEYLEIFIKSMLIIVLNFTINIFHTLSL